MNQSMEESLGRYGKHTPRILRRQLIHQLTEQYLKKESASFVGEKNKETTCCTPSIQRFHGALLFVDISGFTALSLRLSVEELKNHINDYFTKMLDIVDKHGGDVIKFAGDALFITWQIIDEKLIVRQSSNLLKAMTENNGVKFASKMAVEKAVACGVEITAVCGNQRVDFIPSVNADHGLKKAESTGMLRNLLPSMGTMFRNGNIKHGVGAPLVTNNADDNVAYLNVHAGVSTGLMAGIDIGANDRWEYFLVGDPLTKVAIAESQAALGEIVICPESHSLIHPSALRGFPRSSQRISVADLRLRSQDSAECSSIRSTANHHSPESRSTANHNAPDTPTCTCKRMSNGYFQVSRKYVAPAAAKKSRIKTKLDQSVKLDVAFLAESKLAADIEQDVEFAYQTAQGSFSSCVSHVQQTLGSGLEDLTAVPDIDQKIKELFLPWVNSCLTDDLARHAHHVTRDDFRFKNSLRDNVLAAQIQIVLRRAKQKVSPSAVVHSQLLSPANKAILFSMLTKPVSSATDSSFLQLHSPTTRRVLDLQDSNAMAEIRTVTVLFIKIDVTNMELLVDSNVRRSPKNMASKSTAASSSTSWFLTKTSNEAVADQMLLSRLQACFVCLTDAFVKYGGQMRQFIVDDKGTVCIGTFGLRGSVSDDNAAAAIETAKMIVDKLQSLGIDSSIGVTVGRAYCGLVGSSKRHEYAVMGPSTNLSARLMCKAPPCGILCDIETRSRDRTHDFEKLTDIVAKGYKEPVGTFMPIFSAEVPTFDYSDKMNDKRDTFRSAKSDEERIFSGNFSSDRGLLLSRIGSEKAVVSSERMGGECDDFYVVSDKSLRSNATGVKLFGRDAEIERCLMFLFGNDTFAVSRLEGGSAKPVFSLRNKASFVIICGNQGMGRAAVLSTIAHHIYTMTKKTSMYNIQVFKSQSSAYTQRAPFSAWRPVAQEMILRLYQSTKGKTPSDAAKGRRRSLAASLAAVNNELKLAVEHMFTLLPDWQEYSPLIARITHLDEDSQAVAALQMNEVEINAKLALFIVAIIQLFPSVTQRLVFITM